MLIYGYFLQIYVLEPVPSKFDAKMFTDRDLELPGFPIIKIGILFIIQTKVVKIFSFRAEFSAIFLDF